jgi:hypothetical protein
LLVLDLDGTKLTDTNVQELAALRRLRILHISETQVTAAGEQQLKKALPLCYIKR